MSRRLLLPPALRQRPPAVWPLARLCILSSTPCPRSVDFSTLDGSPAEEGASGGGGSSKRRLSAVHTPAARLVGALQAFFKTWGLG